MYPEIERSMHLFERQITELRIFGHILEMSPFLVLLAYPPTLFFLSHIAFDFHFSPSN